MSTSLTQTETNIDASVAQMAFTDDLTLQPEFITETTHANHTANIKVKDNHRNNKKSNNSSTSTIAEKNNIVIFGDSMIKHVSGCEMSKKLENCKVYLKSFSRSKFRWMKDHMKLSMRKKLDHTILQSTFKV